MIDQTQCKLSLVNLSSLHRFHLFISRPILLVVTRKHASFARCLIQRRFVCSNQRKQASNFAFALAFAFDCLLVIQLKQLGAKTRRTKNNRIICPSKRTQANNNSISENKKLTMIDFPFLSCLLLFWNAHTRHLAAQLIITKLVDSQLSQFPPSILAMASMAVAIDGLSMTEKTCSRLNEIVAQIHEATHKVNEVSFMVLWFYAWKGVQSRETWLTKKKKFFLINCLPNTLDTGEKYSWNKWLMLRLKLRNMYKNCTLHLMIEFKCEIIYYYNIII